MSIYNDATSDVQNEESLGTEQSFYQCPIKTQKLNIKQKSRSLLVETSCHEATDGILVL